MCFETGICTGCCQKAGETSCVCTCDISVLLKLKLELDFRAVCT